MHQKRAFVNRCRVAGANGPILLTVPLENGRSQKAFMKDLRISWASSWQQIHWKSLLSAYNGSPWFFQYKDSLSVLYKSKPAFLLDWNLACMDWIMLQLQTRVRFRPLHAGGDGRISMSEGPRNNAEATGKAVPGLPGEIIYSQVFEDKTGFIPDLCILDLLFCEGPQNALRLLHEQASGSNL